MKKKYFISLILVAVNLGFTAQVISTETFETETTASSFFTDNSQVFNITSQAGGTFDVYSNATAYGWNGTANDFKFIDNTGTASFNVPVGFTISSSGAVPFRIVSLWVYMSQSNLSSLGTGGSLTIVGKLAGVTKFTATANSGFNTNATTNNGFTLINFATFGGADNTTENIDQLVFTTTGSFAYVALDTFKWSTAPLARDEFDMAGFKCYPIPANNLLNITYSKNIDSLSLINIFGQEVYTSVVNALDAKINLEGLSNGIYLLKIASDGNKKTVKFVKN